MEAKSTEVLNLIYAGTRGFTYKRSDQNFGVSKS